VIHSEQNETNLIEISLKHGNSYDSHIPCRPV